ncbi:GntR family transcriptional regulator [Streptomyces sp. NPDC017056]|uniref:GntR family transcriptional regulator n=1 Tax=Streptomyces sp. NPDC017056 TaxID=3364973 RepID=UPI0037B963F4
MDCAGAAPVRRAPPPARSAGYSAAGSCELRHENLVEPRQGIGTVVTARHTQHHSPSDRVRSADVTGRIYPPGQYAKILSAELRPAPERVALALGIEEGAQVICRRRVTCDESGPVSVSTSWFAGELARAVPALLATERIPGGTPGAIEEATGRVWNDGQDLVGVRIATDEEAELLGITERPAALFIGYNSLFDEESEVIEYGEYLSAGDRLTRYAYQRPRD